VVDPLRGPSVTGRRRVPPDALEPGTSITRVIAVGLDVRGLHKVSLSDFPGKVACVVFLAGCNLRCPYCHNPDLVWRRPWLPRLPEAELVRFLAERRDFLDGVVVRGG